MRRILAIRFLAAGVWLVFGLGFKVLDLVPRHRQIVAAVLGDDVARWATLLVGLGEAGIAIWLLSGIRPRLCAAVQTLAILSMNTLELVHARPLLLGPFGGIIKNAGLIVCAWIVWRR